METQTFNSPQGTRAANPLLEFGRKLSGRSLESLTTGRTRETAPSKMFFFSWVGVAIARSNHRHFGWHRKGVHSSEVTKGKTWDLDAIEDMIYPMPTSIYTPDEEAAHLRSQGDITNHSKGKRARHNLRQRSLAWRGECTHAMLRVETSNMDYVKKSKFK
mgnify:CR=1 FL=1